MLLGFGIAPKQIPNIFTTDSVIVFGVQIPGEPVLDDGDRDRDHAGAGRALSLDAVRPRHAGGLRERDRGDAGRPVAEPAVDGEHRDGVAGGRADGDHRGATRSGGLDDDDALHRARPRRGAVRPLHVARDRVPRRVPDRNCAVADVLRLDAVVVSDRRWQSAARHAGAPDVRDHRDRALPARVEPADARRAGRATAAAQFRGRSGSFARASSSRRLPCCS